MTHTIVHPLPRAPNFSRKLVFNCLLVVVAQSVRRVVCEQCVLQWDTLTFAQKKKNWRTYTYMYILTCKLMCIYLREFPAKNCIASLFSTCTAILYTHNLWFQEGSPLSFDYRVQRLCFQWCTIFRKDRIVITASGAAWARVERFYSSLPSFLSCFNGCFC